LIGDSIAASFEGAKGRKQKNRNERRRRRLRLSQGFLSITKSLVRNKVIGVVRDGIVG